MLSRRSFLIAMSSLAGSGAAASFDGRVFLSHERTAGTRVDRLQVVDVVDARHVVDAQHVDDTLHIVDARWIRNGRVRAPRPLVRLDGDAGELWHRVLRPSIERHATRDDARRLVAIEGWTSHADAFVLTTLGSAHGIAYGITHGIANRVAHDDMIEWRIELRVPKRI
ncbi:hypothetical protein [Pararobbsia silviterrae]|uniref:Uncharacterized protein n=1 Tax=Pararobbsia silviterrae TaxID=1792498 RepID=A0A494XYX8_9BURK|nr:hypothetical protein [Pararobbsia silviterrae]RKP55722.1 hypothetical protein D7S86_10880 [Pararobbsia silviterrae]